VLKRLSSAVLALSTAAAGQTSVNLPQRPFALMDAMQVTLSRHPSIRIQQVQVDINRGAVRVAAAQFDTQLESTISQNRANTPLTRDQQNTYAQYGLSATNQASNLTGADVNVQRLFRNGITVGPVVQINRNTDNLTNHLGLNQSKVAFQVIVPLMRGRGRDVVAARESAARSDLHAALYDANHTVSQTLGAAAIQYWNAIGAARNLEIARNSEERGKSYASDVKILIDADRVPRGELNQLLANLAGRTSQRIAAEQQLLAAQQSLAIAMGLGSDDVKELPTPTDELPGWSGDTAPAVTSKLVDQFVAHAFERRADLLAARDRQRSAELVVPAARNQLKPAVDLTLSSGYTGLWEGTNVAKLIGAPFMNVKGLDAVGQITYRFPVGNNAAYGQLAQAEASVQQASLRQADLARQISSNVITAMASLSNNAARLKLAREAVRYYQLALDGENEKFRLGIGSLVDVLTMEDRLTGALSQQVSAQVDFASAIVNLRFATGTFLNPEAQTHTLEREIFVKPPFDWEK
jgi:outer membrane protein